MLTLAALREFVCVEREGFNVMAIYGIDTLPIAKQQRTVLVIDDESAIREAVTDILEIGNMNTILASNGRDGLLTFHKRYEEIQAILLDMNMPIMRGDEILPALRDIDPTVKIIISSGYSDVDIGSRIRGGYADAFLPKPYNLTDLLTIIAEVFGELDS